VAADREDARAELVAGALLEEDRVARAVEHVLVGALRRLALDHLGLLPLFADAHGEPADGGALGQRDAEAALDAPLTRVVKAQPNLGEGERPIDHRARLERREPEAHAVARGERDGRPLSVDPSGGLLGHGGDRRPERAEAGEVVERERRPWRRGAGG
jgi:hypothetical protein